MLVGNGRKTNLTQDVVEHLVDTSVLNERGECCLESAADKDRGEKRREPGGTTLRNWGSGIVNEGLIAGGNVGDCESAYFFKSTTA